MRTKRLSRISSLLSLVGILLILVALLLILVALHVLERLPGFTGTTPLPLPAFLIAILLGAFGAWAIRKSNQIERSIDEILDQICSQSSEIAQVNRSERVYSYVRVVGDADRDNGYWTSRIVTVLSALPDTIFRCTEVLPVGSHVTLITFRAEDSVKYDIRTLDSRTIFNGRWSKA